MEVFGPHNTSTCLDINSSGGSSTDPDHLTQYSSKDLSMTDLKTCLTELFDVEDTGSSTNQLNLSTGKDFIGNDVEKCEFQVLEKDAKGNSTSEKRLSKCSTFPPSCESKSVDSSTGEKEKQEEVSAEVSEANGSSKPSSKCYSRSISLPPASAMKGSREKQGIPPKNLSVTWAPDVYDPVPSSVSHVPSSSKNQKYRSNSKRSGKYKQKSASKSSRGGKGKDKDKMKKQVRKSGGGSRLKPFYDNSYGEPQVDTVDYNVGTHDPFCGSSFLVKSVTNLHFPVAEAI